MRLLRFFVFEKELHAAEDASQKNVFLLPDLVSLENLLVDNKK